MTTETSLPLDSSLARQLKQLDGMGMTAAERERAKEYLRRADAFMDVTARAWNCVRSYARRLRTATTRPSRGAAAIR